VTRTLNPGDRISHYRIVAPLGVGGMGEVYRARDETLNRDVALKILPPSLVRNEERLRRFVLEAKSASSLNHPNIVTIYEIGKDWIRSGEGSSMGPSATAGESALVHFISMELVTGETLASKIHREKSELKTLLGWLAQAAEGLAKAHAAGIVHRDLKPGNIMVSKDGYAKVLDFGLAKLTETQVPDAEMTSAPTETVERTGEGVVVGTASYMPPEQVQGKGVDHRSDIFSFGCILYEAATRRKPFAADTGVETMAKILKETPAPIEELNPEAPAELRCLIRRCLAKDPNRRQDSMKALAIELQEIDDEYDALSASGISGSGASAHGMAPVRHGWIIPVVLTCAAVLALGGVAVGIWGFRLRGAAGSEAPTPSMQVTTVTNRGDVGGVALSPDGRYLAYVSGPPEGESLWMRQLSTGSDVQIVPPQETRPRALRFSPDGSCLYYINTGGINTRDNALFQIPFLGGTPHKVASDVDSAITFAPDGRRVCFRRDTRARKLTALIVLDLESGEERTLATAEVPQFFRGQPAWSPDGERIAVIESGSGGGNRSGITIFGAEDGRREPFDSDTWRRAVNLFWLPDSSGLLVVGNQTLMPQQIWLQPFPRGRARRVTSDWISYQSVSVSGDGTIIASNRSTFVANLWTVDALAGGEVRQLTFNSNYASTVVDFDTDRDGSIVFTASGNEQWHLWRIAEGGSEPKSITSGRGNEIGPRCLTGGGVVFGRAGMDQSAHIFLAEGEGGNPRPLTSGSGETLIDLSPDGKVVLFVGGEDDPTILWAVPVQGGQPSRLAGSYLGSAQFSRDGGRIVYNEVVPETEGIPRNSWRVIPAAGGEPLATLLLPPQTTDVGWAPDGKALTFLDGADAAANVFVQRLDGGKLEPITRFAEGQITGHAWSPDGKRLLLKRHIGQVDNLWIVAADGTNPIRLTDFRTGDIFEMEWMIDGHGVVFMYGSYSSDAVLIRNFR